MQIDAAILPTIAGLLGSLIGGTSTFAASWFTHRGQLRAEMVAKLLAARQAVYAEFISEASKRVAEAWGHHAESPADIAVLYGAIEQMRLTSSAEVIVAADKVIRQIVEAYAAPDRTFEDLRHSLAGGNFSDPIRHFSEVCRKELNAFGR
jgi:hypothetical protein